MGIIKIKSQKTGKLLRFESKEGVPLAIVRDGKLEMTFDGMKEGLAVKGGRLVNRSSGVSAY